MTLTLAHHCRLPKEEAAFVVGVPDAVSPSVDAADRPLMSPRGPDQSSLVKVICFTPPAGRGVRADELMAPVPSRLVALRAECHVCSKLSVRAPPAPPRGTPGAEGS